MFEFLAQVYFGSTLEQYAYFLIGIAFSVVLGKAIAWIFENTLAKVAKKTTSHVDDFLIQALKTPITIAIILIGIFFSFSFLTIDENVQFVKNGAFLIAATIFVAWLLTKINDAFIDKIVKPKVSKSESKLDDHLLPITKRAIKIIIWLLAAITILGNLGYDVTTIIAGLGIGGLAIAFAAQRTIADIFGGISILFSKPFLIGDIIEVKSLNLIGTVHDISLRHTKIMDFDKRINTVPNSDLSSAVIKNISSETKHKIITDIGLTYNTSMKKMELAKKIVTKIVESHERCDKEPLLLFNEFKDFSINLRIVYYTSKVDWLKTQDQINTKIKQEFDKNKIEFAFPTQTVYLKKGV